MITLRQREPIIPYNIILVVLKGVFIRRRASEVSIAITYELLNVTSLSCLVEVIGILVGLENGTSGDLTILHTVRVSSIDAQGSVRIDKAGIQLEASGVLANIVSKGASNGLIGEGNVWFGILIAL